MVSAILFYALLADVLQAFDDLFFGEALRFKPLDQPRYISACHAFHALTSFRKRLSPLPYEYMILYSREYINRHSKQYSRKYIVHYLY